MAEWEQRIERETLAQFEAQTRLLARMQHLALWAGWWDAAEELKAHRQSLEMTRCLCAHDATLSLDVLEASSREVDRLLAVFEQRTEARYGKQA